ncbi:MULTISPECIES: DUF4760 domain-containing protein [Bradyrhizobium]|jgi:hypothetical protein|uniref:DUF4760 domain-containing protein n=1 Tax=Bradyrhizobium TaxID=374 RepID=UPI001BACA795|nr:MULTISPECIES: hypothetical protein [Bradyrhizobium]MBR0812796.1 hypothetical protein [Bradyrhizobium diazoefficiens]WOH70437.1 hypothetical protein RX330_19215 [Bradyrhizobium sp. NDS-1]
MIARVYRRLIQIGKVSGAISFLIAAPYALVQYWQARDNARVEQTLGFYKLYNSKPFTDYREKLTKALVKYRAQLNVAAQSTEQLLATQVDLVKSEDVEMELLLLFDFFDGVAVCVASDVCDNDTAVRLFRPRAIDIYLNFYQYMKAQRAGQPTSDYGAGLEAIARSGQAPQRKE